MTDEFYVRIKKQHLVLVLGLVGIAATLSIAAVLTFPLQTALSDHTADDVPCPTTHCVGNADIANKAVGSAKIKDGSIQGIDITTNPVLSSGLKWANGKSSLTEDQGGAIELGDSLTTAAGPYIDFHFGTETAEDFNARLQNNGDHRLSVYTQKLTVEEAPAFGITDPRIGIGTSNPLTALHIPAKGLQIGTSNIASENFYITSNPVSGELIIWNGNHGTGTRLMQIQSNGNVQIGQYGAIGQPPYKLFVGGSFVAAGDVTLGSPTSDSVQIDADMRFDFDSARLEFEQQIIKNVPTNGIVNSPALFQLSLADINRVSMKIDCDDPDGCLMDGFFGSTIREGHEGQILILAAEAGDGDCCSTITLADDGNLHLVSQRILDSEYDRLVLMFEQTDGEVPGAAWVEVSYANND